MPELSAAGYKRLRAFNRMPHDINVNIWFDGNETLQKKPGKHHLKEFQETGTYDHPEVVRVRQDLLRDLVKRLAEGKMSPITFKNKIVNLKKFLEKCEENDVLIKPDVLEGLYYEASLLDSTVLASDGKSTASYNPDGSVDNAPSVDPLKEAERSATAKGDIVLENSDKILEL